MSPHKLHPDQRRSSRIAALPTSTYATLKPTATTKKTRTPAQIAKAKQYAKTATFKRKAKADAKIARAKKSKEGKIRQERWNRGFPQMYAEVFAAEGEVGPFPVFVKGKRGGKVLKFEH